MARRQRFHSPDSTYHVMLRGNDGQDIFFSKSDKLRLCFLLQQCSERFDHKIEAFCFMTNHIHLALRVSDTSISKFVHYLAFRYARYINKKYKRVGHLFQGRFKSILVDDANYVKELIRYIHLNPVRAKLVTYPEQYLWSSYRAYLNHEEITWLSKDRILNRFHPEIGSAICNFEKFVLAGIGVKTTFDFKSGFTDGVFGNEEFVNTVLEQSSPLQKRKIELSELVDKVCAQQNLSVKELREQGKHAKYSKARALLVLLIKEINHLSLQDIGKYLGRNSSGLSKLASRLEIKSVTSPIIATEIQELRNWLTNYIKKQS